MLRFLILCSLCEKSLLTLWQRGTILRITYTHSANLYSIYTRVAIYRTGQKNTIRHTDVKEKLFLEHILNNISRDKKGSRHYFVRFFFLSLPPQTHITKSFAYLRCSRFRSLQDTRPQYIYTTRTRCKFCREMSNGWHLTYLSAMRITHERERAKSLLTNKTSSFFFYLSLRTKRVWKLVSALTVSFERIYTTKIMYPAMSLYK